MCIRKALLVGTDLGLLGYWTLSLIGIITVGAHDATLHTWNWSFVPLDLVAIILGLAWSFTPQHHQLSQPLQITALAFTHAAGLMAISFFAQQPAEWGPSWWLVNLWSGYAPILVPSPRRCTKITPIGRSFFGGAYRLVSIPRSNVAG